MSSATSFVCDVDAKFNSEMTEAILSRFLELEDGKGVSYGESEDAISRPSQAELQGRHDWPDYTRHYRTPEEQERWPENMWERIKFELEGFPNDPVEVKEVMAEIAPKFLGKHFSNPALERESSRKKRETYIVAVYLLEPELDESGNPIMENGKPKMRRKVDPRTGKPKEGIRVVAYNYNYYGDEAARALGSGVRSREEIEREVGETQHVKAARQCAQDIQKKVNQICNETEQVEWMNRSARNPGNLGLKAIKSIESRSKGAVKVVGRPQITFTRREDMTTGNLNDLFKPGKQKMTMGGRLTLRCKTIRKRK